MNNNGGRQKQPGLQQIHLSHQKCRIDEDLFELEKEHFLLKLENFQTQKASMPQLESIQTTFMQSDVSFQLKPQRSILKHGRSYRPNKHCVRFRT